MKLLALLALAACAPRLLAPREVPAPRMPPLPEPAPAPDAAAVAIDADEPARVDDGDATVCARTPCAVSLGLGAHQLRLTSLAHPDRRSADALQVSGPRLDYRMNLGHTETPELYGALPLGVGLLATTFSLPLVAAGDVGGTDLGTPGKALLISGLVLTAVGAVMLAGERSTYQASTSLVWTPQRRLPSADH